MLALRRVYWPKIKMRILKTILVLALLVAVGAVTARANDDTEIDQDISKLGKAFQNHDYPTIIDMMYAPAVQAGGGRDQLIAQAAAIGDQGKMISFAAIKPFRRISGSKNDYVVIPTHTIIEVEENRYASESFQLAVRPHGGGAWQYLDGPGLTPQLQAMFFSDLPPDTVFPQHTTSLVEPSNSDQQPTQELQPTKVDASQTQTSEMTGKDESKSPPLVLILVGVGLSSIILILFVLFMAMSSRPKLPRPRRTMARVPPMK